MIIHKGESPGSHRPYRLGGEHRRAAGRGHGSELQQRVDAYAQGIYRINAEVQQLGAERPGNVHRLRPRSRSI
jgi:hypothetical protein